MVDFSVVSNLDDFEEWEINNLSELEERVYDKHNIWIEPSVQGGMGGVWFYSNEDDMTLVSNYDYQTFVDSIREICMECETEDDFVNKFDAYIGGILERYE